MGRNCGNRKAKARFFAHRPAEGSGPPPMRPAPGRDGAGKGGGGPLCEAGRHAAFPGRTPDILIDGL
jgi:hypothetical protein